MDIVLETRKRLFDLSDEKYKKFSSSLIVQKVNMIGVRLPILRKIAKDIIQNNWQKYLDFQPVYFEEIMLQGMIIGQLNLPFENLISYVEKFIPKIDNWSVCDSFCCSLKFVLRNKDLFWQFMQKYLYSKQEFEMRFAMVMLLNFYVEEKYLDRILAIINEFISDKYYAQMAAAWLISVCYTKFPRQTFNFLKLTKLDNKIYNMSIQKILESNKVNKNQKIMIKKLKKSNSLL